MTSLKGRLLVAAPNLLDPNFVQTVVLLFEHGEEGAAGLVLNRLTEKSIAEVWEPIFHVHTDWDKKICLGGPVAGPLTAVHTTANLSDGEIFPNLFMTVDPDKLRQLVAAKREPCQFFANYSGWGSGQLENELEERAWRVAHGRTDHVFSFGDQDLWREVTDEVEYSRRVAGRQDAVSLGDPDSN